MKTLGIITLFLLAIIISVGVSVYVIQQQLTENSTQRFQLVFGEIIHESAEPSDEPGMVSVKSSRESVCFKFDTLTGETWRYVSSFYKDPNQLVTTLGFEQVYEDSYPYEIREVTKRDKPQKTSDWKSDMAAFKEDISDKPIRLSDIPESEELAKPKNRLEDFDLQSIKKLNDPNRAGENITIQELISGPNKPKNRLEGLLKE